MSRACLYSLLLVSLVGTGSAQEIVSVRVGAEALGEVPPLATNGFNYGNSMLVVGSVEEFEAIRIGSLRFPPGNQADEIELGRHDLDALDLNLGLLGRPPVLMVANLFEGTAEQAAELARLAESMGLPLLGWEVGNEPDLYATNRSDPSWTPERYCQEFRRYGSALREVNPDYLLAGPAVSGARPGGAEYLSEVLRLCGDAIDILTWHVYPTDGTWSNDEALATAARFAEELRLFRGWASDPTSNPLGYEQPPLLGVTEFGLSWRSNSYRHLEDMTAAHWLADVLGQMTSERLDLSSYFTLQGMGGHGLIGTGGWVRPTYFVYELLDDFTGEVVEVEAEPPLRGYAVSSDDETRVLLVNPSNLSLSAALQFDRPVAEELQLSLLSEEIFDELLEPQTLTAPPLEPVLVPGRAILLVRANHQR